MITVDMGRLPRVGITASKARTFMDTSAKMALETILNPKSIDSIDRCYMGQDMRLYFDPANQTLEAHTSDYNQTPAQVLIIESTGRGEVDDEMMSFFMHEVKCGVFSANLRHICPKAVLEYIRKYTAEEVAS